MKKIFLILTICLAANFGAKAQYVNIPDTNFGKFLIAKYPSCLYWDTLPNKYYMDTTCSGVVGATTLDCSNKNIKSIEGIEYFENLYDLRCTQNQIAIISKLPNKLGSLSCSMNSLQSLPIINNSLIFLACDYNPINNISSLPDSLRYFQCNSTNIHCISYLPVNMHTFHYSDSQFACIPNKPLNLQMQSVPLGTTQNLPICNSTNNPNNCPTFNPYINIPDTAFGKFLIAQYPSCLYKDTAANKYYMDTTCGAVLSEDSIICSNKAIANIEGIQYFRNLQLLYCDSNNLSQLPTLSNNLIHLKCLANSNLFCLPKFPSSLKYLSFDGNNIKCVPSSIVGFTQVVNPASNSVFMPFQWDWPVCTNDYNPNCTIIPNNYVTLTDTGFVEYLQLHLNNGYTNFVSSFQIDTTLAENFTGNTMQLFSQSYAIKNINGIKYFKKLNTLTIDKNAGSIPLQVSSIPQLPADLKQLNIQNLQLTNVTALPNGIEIVNCKQSKINHWESFGNALTLLDLSQCENYNLPSLPNTLVTLDVSNGINSHLDSLPLLPNSLKTIDCSNNIIKYIPNIPTALTDLYCINNALASLPNLPNTLTSLDCAGNQNLKCLPVLPVGLTFLNVDTGIHCLPNIPSGLTTTLPICNTTNNPNNCPIYNPYINIPDTNFGKFLIAKYPSCLYKDSAANKYYMDTTCSAVVNETILNCSSLSIFDIKGVEYFHNLKELELSDNQISVIPILSNSIKWLRINNNNITVLTTLPDSLFFFDCSFNKLTSINNLPNSLRILYFKNNKISIFPNLSDSLQEVYLGHNLYNQLGNLPKKLQRLECRNLNLTTLPSLPNTLIYLICDSNQLTNLPITNDSIIQLLSFENNLLTTLPNYPKLTYLNCAYNLINNLGGFNMDIMSVLICNNNQNLFCLPKLPNRFDDYGFNIKNTSIHCLPNIPNGLVSNSHHILPPICNPTNNPNQCHIYPSVSGKVFTDNNSNAVKDTLEFYRPFVKLSLNNGQYTYSNLQGAYGISVDTLGSYTLKVTPPPYYKAVPDSVNINFAANTSVVLPEIALQPIASIDSFAIHITKLNLPRPGFKYAYNVSYGNVGTISSANNNIVTAIYDTTKLHFDSASVAIQSNTNVGGNYAQIAVNAGSLVAGQGGTFNLYYTVKPTVAIGDSIRTVAAISYSSTKTYSVDSAIVIGSYDPNDKQATPTLTPQQVQNGDYIDYTIRFQNTGNANATNIVIADTLSSLLQFNNIQIVASSHNSNISYRVGNGIIYFEFFNINLPYQSANEPLSHGFVSFKVKALPTLASGAIVPNTAHIYFDYNSPIVTNTATTQVKAIVTPVRIINYTVSLNEKRETRNLWTVGVEVNVSHYVIQRSSNSKEFTNVGEVAASGVSSYSFLDKLPTNYSLLPVIYYRLKIVDKDGKTSYSEIKKLTRNEKRETISIFPNPAKDVVNIEVEGGKELLIIDALGKTVITKSILNAQYSIFNIQSLNKGVYLVRLIMKNGEVKTSKLIIE